MMVAMMLPSLVPMLGRYREAVDLTGNPRLGWLTVRVGLGYFVVWGLLGVAVFPVGVAVATVEMERAMVARAVPLASGAVVLMAGAFQFTAWKARQLACCRDLPSASGGRCRNGLATRPAPRGSAAAPVVPVRRRSSWSLE